MMNDDQQTIEFWENEYLKQIEHCLRIDYDKMMYGFATKEYIKDELFKIILIIVYIILICGLLCAFNFGVQMAALMAVLAAIFFIIMLLILFQFLLPYL